MLRFFGATVEELEDDLRPAPWAPEGAIARATEIAEKPDFHMLNQYRNPSNPDAHYRTTGPEIWRQTEGTITHFVAGMGHAAPSPGQGVPKSRAQVSRSSESTRVRVTTSRASAASASSSRPSSSSPTSTTG